MRGSQTYYTSYDRVFKCKKETLEVIDWAVSAILYQNDQQKYAN